MAIGKTDTWYPMYPADYLKDTLALTLEEDGFYRRAVDQVYIHKGRIPADPLTLQRLLRITPAQLKRCAGILEKYFYRDGDSYRNRRADIEIARAQGRAEVARENGRRGGGRPKNNPAETQRVISGLPTNNPEGGPEKNSSQSQSDPPYTPPTEFRTAFPILCRAFAIENPSHRDELAMFEAWSELRAKKATSTDLARRIARYREMWPELPCTPNAVLKHWHTCKPLEKPVPVVGGDAIPDSLLEDGDD